MEESLTKTLFHAIETGFKCLYLHTDVYTNARLFKKILKIRHYNKFSQS